MWRLSGFTDEIGQDFAEQVAVASTLGLRHAEVRTAWDHQVIDLDDQQIAEMGRLLRLHDMSVSSIGSPIGKIAIEDDFEPHMERMRRTARIARLLDAPYIRLFSFYIRPDQDHSQQRSEVLRRMAALAGIAEESGVIALHENEKGIYGDIPERCLDIVEGVGSAYLRLAWDPANFVQVGIRPCTDGFSMLLPHVEYIQVKDAHMATGEVTVAGEGDGEVRETVRSLRAAGFDGYFSLEPHLDSTEAFREANGVERFTAAHRAFTTLLDDEGIAFS